MKPQDAIGLYFSRRGYWVYQEVPLGLKDVHPNRPRADVYALREYLPLEVHIVEWKETRADFLSDIKSEKWIKYLDHCRHFSFATKYGIVTAKDIPEGVGWLEQWEHSQRIGGKGFDVRIASYDYEFTMTTDQWMTLISRHHKSGRY